MVALVSQFLDRGSHSWFENSSHYPGSTNVPTFESFESKSPYEPSKISKLSGWSENDHDENAFIMTLLFNWVLFLLLHFICSAEAFINSLISNSPALKGSRQQCSESVDVEGLLHDNGFGLRLVTLRPSNLPLIGEVHDHGALYLCRIVSIEAPSKTSPRFRVEPLDDLKGERIVELGQITTVWDSNVSFDNNRQEQCVSPRRCEAALQELYHQYSAIRSHSITKKQLQQITSDPYAQDILRKVLKAGNKMIRLVDSSMAQNYLYNEDSKSMQDTMEQRAFAAKALAEDASAGGRFKRFPCIYIHSSINDSGDVSSVVFVNGGWLVVDPSVRAGAEARKFVERTVVSTEADERIARRLECLAMGQVVAENQLEVDVRQCLKVLNLDATPEGARQALVAIGRWSEQQPNRMEPWSQETLEAANLYAVADANRQSRLAKQGADLEDRVDLRHLPSICIDAKTTTFRDDAISIRPRSSTGRKVIPEASKWELLIHIADVSDLYCDALPDSVVEESVLKTLRECAVGRGLSRYDLPLGPLHLLPPVLLESLSFVAQTPGESKSGPNRCVTVWVYIDEGTGKIVDCGLERTLISSPTALTYQSATQLLDTRLQQTDDHLVKIASVLALAERNLMKWSSRYKKYNQAAKKRDERLRQKELRSEQQAFAPRFERTRGHVLVDMALDLYSVVITKLLRHYSIPRASGRGSDRGGRVATAPLRRYVDGMAQRQALSVLCNFGGTPLGNEECQKINRETNEAMNRLDNIVPLKKTNRR
jgi:hypothetical protein